MSIKTRVEKLEKARSVGFRVVMMRVEPELYGPNGVSNCDEAKVTWPDGERVFFRSQRETFEEFKHRIDAEGLAAARSQSPGVVFLPAFVAYV